MKKRLACMLVILFAIELLMPFMKPTHANSEVRSVEKNVKQGVDKR